MSKDTSIKWRDDDAEDLNGCADKTGLRNTVRHEAGHVIIAWLLDNYLVGVIAAEEGGMTQAFTGLSSKYHPCHGILYSMAGMEFSNEREVLFDLRDHVDDEEYFQDQTDSQMILKIVKSLKANSFQMLFIHQTILSRLRRKFSKPYNEVVRLLMEAKGNALHFLQLYELYGKWDIEFGFDKRPKSDYLNRMIAREHKWTLPKCKYLDWNMKPLENWEYKRPTLEEMVAMVKEHLDAKK